jgi:Ca-activated chloride channel family protein
MKPTILIDHDPPAPGLPLTVRVLLTLAGTPPSDASRIPLNLSLVLDRSGSMTGAKIDAAREAAALALQRLWPEDVASVVAYDHEVHVVAEPATGERQRDLPRLVRTIQTRGSTNVSGGWLKGRELLERHRREGGVNRILLLTDGLANQGITDPQALMGLCRNAAVAGITTTTIGFGADFDETLLRSMADAGGGATYYIEEADQAPGVFEEELAGLLSLCAQNVAAEVRTGPVVRLAAVRHAYPSRPTDGGIGVRLELGDLYAREPKRLLVELLVASVPASGPTELARISLAADVLEADGSVVRRELDLPVLLDVEGGARVDAEVRRESLLLDAAAAREAALERYHRGDHEGSAGQLRDAGLFLREAGLAYDDVLEEAQDLSSLAAQLEARPMSRADEKYLEQRAYDLNRSRREASKRISRQREE